MKGKNQVERIAVARRYLIANLVTRQLTSLELTGKNPPTTKPERKREMNVILGGCGFLEKFKSTIKI